MRILITGAEGFIGKNLQLRLSGKEGIDVVTYARSNSFDELPELLANTDFIFHLAGINRPYNPKEFTVGNVDLTTKIVEEMINIGCKAPIIYTSSIQAVLDNPYGESKRQAENVLLKLGEEYKVPVSIFRLPNVFGKWARPNYNSVIATFCYNIVNNLTIKIDDPNSILNLVYIDDVISHFLKLVDGSLSIKVYDNVSPNYQITLGDLVKQLYRFHDSRRTLTTEPVGKGLIRALYSTYLSYLPKEHFVYEVPKYSDPRGEFVEILKTPTAGQFSFFTAYPGTTRGGHYHHTKTEKFLVIKGKARFRFRHMLTGQFYELVTTGSKPEIVETVPGWTHDISNIGDDEMVVMLWANEIFDRDKPDTYACSLV